MFNLLTDSLIRVVRKDGGTAVLTLPGVYAAMVADDVMTFHALRAHQAPAWHVFLVQLAVLACENAGISQCPGAEAGEWARLLGRLTSDWPDDEPWRLVTGSDAPAFLQPASPANGLADYRQTASAPDTLDLLVNSKNHDFKAERMARAAPDDWIFALISLQTQEGFLGRGNYGIARMNGGFGSRPFLGLAPAVGGFGAAVMRDVAAMLASDSDWEGRCNTIFNGDARSGLVWTKPWDGKTSLALTGLHPLFIEVCRRVRLEWSGERLIARLANSEGPRLSAKENLGVLFDPWAPVEMSEPPKLLTLSSDGFTYSRLVELLFGSSKRHYHLPRLAKPTRDERTQPMRLWAAALVRGQGKTEGFHTRTLVLPAKATRAFAEEIADLAARAKDQVRLAAEMARSCLRPALIILVQKGPAEPAWTKPSNDNLIGPTLKRFDQDVDEGFFPALWGGLDLSSEAAESAWIHELRRLARINLDKADESAPRGSERRIMAVARATEMLEGAIAKTFPQIRQKREREGEAHDRNAA
jgi:CRISPR system Cascade subunit CasA